MVEFEEIFTNNQVSSKLKIYLSSFYYSVIFRPIDLRDLKLKLISLFEYLSSEEGRTDQNCIAVDSFMMLSEKWEKEYFDLPYEYSDIISIAGECLHDTISSPKTTGNFGGTPEQLLASSRKL